jgi:hypothetical protein
MAKAVSDVRPALATPDQTNLPTYLTLKLDRHLFTVFTVRDGQIVHLRDYAHRSDALADAGLDYQWHYTEEGPASGPPQRPTPSEA